MRLHLFQDEKIINRTIFFFEKVYPGENKFVVVLPKNKIKCKYVNVDNTNVFVVHYNTEEFWRIIGQVNCYNEIIIHYLTDDMTLFLSKIDHPNIYWIEWGGDLYNHLLRYKGFQLYYDDNLVAKMRKPRWPVFLYKLLDKFNVFIKAQKRIKVLHKIKYFLPDSMYDEYPMIINAYPQFNHLIYKDFFYYPLHEILGDLSNSLTRGSKIIIGNSCSFTNNHIHVFNELKKIDVNNKIVVPLSYSGNQRYREFLINKGEELFGSRFEPVTEYMSLAEYNNLLLSANVFIYGNLRQEAVGNILIALYIGGSVFLDDNNPLLSFYKRLGLEIYPLSELTSQRINSKLSYDKIMQNRQILEKYYSNERLEKIIKQNF